VRISFGGASMAPQTMTRAREVLPVVPSLTNGDGMTKTYGILMLGGGRALVVCRWPGSPLG